jgi:hypothetical protein
MKKLFILLFANAAIISCKKSGSENPPHQPAEEKGYVTGKVIDTKGNPVKGASVYIDNTIFYNSGINTSTDENGNNKIKSEMGSYRAYAELMTTFNGHQFKIQFHPDNYDAFSGVDGAVRNFQWKLTGEKPFNPGTYYGGLVTLYKDPDSDMYDAENVEFTFTPVGNLIDGSEGQVITKQCGTPYSPTYYYIPDIPIGRYKITATYKPTGQQLKVRNGRNFNDAFANNATLDFYGTDAPVGAENNMYIEYTDK